MIGQELRSKLEREAFRSPTVHNVQPWIIEISDTYINIYDNLERTLAVGDPELHDHEISLGAFIEGIHLILSTAGLGVSQITSLNETRVHNGKNLRSRYSLNITSGYPLDSLSQWILKRKSYRGKFLPSKSGDQKILESLDSSLNISVTDRDGLKHWARLYDSCAEAGNAHRPLQDELYSWLRLRPSHPSYNRDGLNREALSISSLEGAVADLLLRPKVYAFFNRLGLGKLLVSEAPQIISGTGILFVFRDPKVSLIENGRRFYRLWLSLTEQNFYACPISSLIDQPKGRDAMAEKFPGQTVLGVLRVGRAPFAKLYTSPRLPIYETLLGDKNEI